MGENTYSKIQKVLKDIVGKTYHKNKLWKRIMVMIGSDERTIRSCMYLMISLNLIKEVKQDYYKIISFEANI